MNTTWVAGSSQPRAIIHARNRPTSQLNTTPTARPPSATATNVRLALVSENAPVTAATRANLNITDLLIFIAAGVILLSLISACIALPLLLRGIEKSPDDKRRQEVRDAWRKTAEAAIYALETEEVAPQDAAQAALAAELKVRIMSEYRHQLDVFNDSAEAQALAFQMDLLERHLRLKALRAQRLELYSLSRHHQVGDDVLREVLADFDLSEAKLGQVK